jgi:hypothetical protein
MLAELVAASKLVSIDVVRVYSERQHGDVTSGPIDWSAPDALVDVQTHLGTPAVFADDGIAFICGIKCEWRSGDNDSKRILAHVDVSVRIAYDYSAYTGIKTEALIGEFGVRVASHQSWPFLRERVRTMSAELGVPPLLLPLKHLAAEKPVPTSDPTRLPDK